MTAYTAPTRDMQFVINELAGLAEVAARLVAAISGRDIATAKTALSQSGGAVKLAVLIAAGATPEQAAAHLRNSGGVLGPALSASTTQGHPTGSIV